MILKSNEKTDINMSELIVEIDAASFEKAVEAAYQHEKKNIALPGFRKGKVPRKMCERTFGENVFYEQAINLVLNMEMGAVIEESGLELVDAPKVELVSVDKEAGVTLKISCVTKPEINIADYKGMSAPKVVREVTDEDVDNQIQSMRQRNARVVSVDDRAAEMGDEVKLDFEGFFGDEAFEGGKGEDFQLKLGSGQFIPGFEEQVAGNNIGENFDVVVSFPEDYQMTDYAGKEATFKCKINAISCEELPELDDEFVKDASDFETVDELKADIRKKMEESAENAAQNAFENALINELIAKVQDPIPHCMFERRAETLLDSFASQLKQNGIEMDLYLQYTGMEEDALKATYLERAENEVKLRLALEKIAVLEGIEVSEEEMDAELAKLAEENNLDLAVVKARIPMDDFKTDMLVTKAMDLIKDSAVVDNTKAEAAEEEKTEE
ncbi:MAG: trigger factor [Ruminococcus sp.]|nr:trigger factor [Ruminococcus sp.]